MKHSSRLNRRRELELKMSDVFGEHVKVLSSEMQKILLDDLVTAFENRMIVMNRTKGS